MAEYINREDVREMMRMEFDDDYADEAVDSLPAADVAPVRRGFRRRTGEIYACEGLVEVKCSECEETNLFDVIRYETSARYCPYCGAKWKRGADNGK